MKKKITVKKRRTAKPKTTTKKKGKRKVATATHEPATHTNAKPEPTEKEKADKALADQIERDGPSTLLVEPPKSETDRLRDEGIPIASVAVAPLPGGGPSTKPGMSAGHLPPTDKEVQEGLDAQKKELDADKAEREKKQKAKQAK